MPKRSPGCAACRKRKIRCDEARPGCARCTTHGTACPGYRQDARGGVSFEDQTDLTVRQANRKYHAKQQQQRQLEGIARRSVEWEVSSTPSEGLFSSEFSVGDSSSRSDNLDRSQQSSEAAWTMTSTSTPSILLSPAIMRVGLYSTLVQCFFPRNATLDRFDFYNILTSAHAEHPALVNGMDTLSMVVVGNAHGDQAVVKQAQLSYDRALKSLMKALASPHAQSDDQVLAAITVLQSCGMYRATSQGADWIAHLQGGQALVAARGPEAFQSPLSRLIYSDAKHGVLIHSLISRKATFLATPEWRALAFKAPTVNKQTYFYDMAIQLPALLEQHDKFETKAIQRTASDIDSLLAECHQLEDGMRNWFADWETQTAIEQEPLSRLRPLEEFPTFTSLCSDRTFDHALDFVTFGVAYLYTLYWQCMFFLRSCVQSLHKMRHQLGDAWRPDTREAVNEGELLMLVISLCQSIPFFNEGANVSGQISMFMPLRTASMYFKQHGHWREATWVRNVVQSVFVKGVRAPDVSHV